MIRWLAAVLWVACQSTPRGTGAASAGPGSSAPAVAAPPTPVVASSAPLPSASASASERRGVQLVAYSGTEALDSFMMRELARAAHDRRELLIYVGATWCEPCRYFHEAAARGDLDQTFPTLRLVELDRDRDEHQLEQTSCLSPMIPMFAKPTPRGNCSDKMIHGSIKGPGAVDEITPRLRRLLEAK